MNTIVESSGQAGRFSVGTSSPEQIVFAGSHLGLAGSPVAEDRILAFVTVSNSGPRGIRVWWDGSPPHYETGIAGAGGPVAATDQYAPVMPNNSITVAVRRAVKVQYAPELDPHDTGDAAQGALAVSWCCPTRLGQSAAGVAGGGGGFAFTASGPAPAPSVAAGASETVGDFLLTGTGGVAGTKGTANVTLTLNATIVRVAGQPVYLLIDNPAAPVTGVNRFAGAAAGANAVTFANVPLVQPGPGAARLFQITNLRVSTQGLSSGSAIVATASIAASFPAPVTDVQQILGVVA